ncbi:MAG: hypothetical protein CSB47_03140 [Proteobacteria bacterium]|nr:MAG: hypothetical protein CSB47_03140 [Pseudomonadota bacterium]
MVNFKALLSVLFVIVLAIVLIMSCTENNAPDEPSKPYALEESEATKSFADDSASLRSARQIGNILYNPPSEMTLNVTETVEVRIGQGAISEAGLIGHGDVEKESIPISQVMSVRLCCGDSSKGDPFDIHTASAEEQLVDGSLVDDKQFTEWVFQVTPRKKGVQQLQLIVSAHYTFDNGKTISRDQVLNRQIQVRVDKAREAQNWLARYWQWLGLLLVIPLAAFIISRRGKNTPKRPKLSGNEAIFISYRRDDSSGYTLAIYEKLKSTFGNEYVFMDVDDIPHGEDFAKHIEKVLSAANTVLVMIGTDWLNASNEQGRRLDDPDDVVRMEIATALAKNLRVIPVLLKGADMPDQASLPEDLKALSMRNAIRIHDDQFNASVERLITSLRVPTAYAP